MSETHLQRRHREFALAAGRFLGALVGAFGETGDAIQAGLNSGLYRFQIELGWPQLTFEVKLQDTSTGKSTLVASVEKAATNRSAALN